MPIDLLIAGTGLAVFHWGTVEAPDYGPADITGAVEVDRVTTGRGQVIRLSAQQRVNRARYLAGELAASGLDPFVRQRAEGDDFCPPIYYRLKVYNGGKDPTAPDCATRWSAEGSTFVNVTSDCIGAAAWIGGWDRYQPARFAHLYGGWINTDSMIMDAQGPAKCFRLCDPYPGCYVVSATGSGPAEAIGHIGTVIDVPAGFDPERDSWARVAIVDVASRGSGVRANKRSTALGWQSRGGLWIEPIM